MALEEVLLEGVIAGASPLLRFWEWQDRALILGSHQVLANEVDLEAAAGLGFAVARRMSGGGTMLVEPERTLTYSIIAPSSLVAGLSFVESFGLLDGWVVETLRRLGVPAAHRPLNDIVSPEGKIGGAAQARRRGAVLHHTTIAHQVEAGLVPRLIRIGRERVSPLGVRSAEKVVSPLGRWLAGSWREAADQLAAGFAERFPVLPGRLSETELEAARRLAGSKYSTPEWIHRLG